MGVTLKKSETKPETTQEAAAPETVVLELAIYVRYMRADELYEKGQAYRFTKEQADVLLRESDEVNGMPIWRMHRPKNPQRVMVEREVGPKDMTTADLKPLPVAEVAQTKGIHIGDDSELEGILPAGDEDGGVTV